MRTNANMIKQKIKYIFLPAVALFIFSCSMQTNKNEEQKQYSSKEGENPKVNVKVNKKYDDKGNLIRYDSTYSYVYSSGGKDSVKESVDSVFKRFRSYYNENFSANMDKKLNELFWNDSLFKYDFMNKDFFSKRFELNEERMDTIFREMDSLKNEFLKKPKKELHGKPRT